MWCSFVLVALAANPYLDEGRRHFGNLEFDAAARSLAIATEQPGLSVAERREAFDVYAQALLALQRRDDAIAAYRRLLQADAYAPAPQAAPKVVECFLAAKRSAYPPPAVKATARVDGRSVTVSVFDPWGEVKRVRWFEATASGLNESAAARVVDHQVTLESADGTQRVLFDALGAGDVLLDHVEVELGPVAPDVVAPAPAPSSSKRTLFAAGSFGAAALSGGLSALFFGFAFRPAPALSEARLVNAWNDGRAMDAGLGWALGGLAVAATVTAVLILLGVFPD